MSNISLQSESAKVAEVVRLIVSGETTFDVHQAIEQQFPGDDAAALMLGALLHFEEASHNNGNIVRGWVFECSREVYRRAMEAEDFSTALRALKQIGEMASSFDGDPSSVQEAGIVQP